MACRSQSPDPSAFRTKSPACFCGTSDCPCLRIGIYAFGTLRQRRNSAQSRARHSHPHASFSWLIECNRCNRARCVGANAWKRTQTFRRLREHSAHLVRDNIGGNDGGSAPALIAKPRPRREHVIERRFRQSPHIRPALEKFPVVGTNRNDRRLLQHDLRQPDTIRIGRLVLFRACQAAHDDGYRTRRAEGRWGILV